MHCRPSGGVRGALEAGRECRYSGASRVIGSIKWHWGILGDVGALGALGAIRGVEGALEVAGGLGASPHWTPVQGPSTPTGSPWGVTYLTKAR